MMPMLSPMVLCRMGINAYPPRDHPHPLKKSMFAFQPFI